MNIPSSILTMLAGIFLTLVSLWYGQNNGLLPVAASAEAELVDGLFNALLTISVGLVILVEAVLIIAAIRFRRQKGDEGDGPHIEGNIPLEILWTSIPAVIVLGISVYSFEIYTEMGGLTLNQHHGSPATTVQVAYQTGNTDPAWPGQAIAKATGGIGSLPDRGGPAVTVNVTALQYAFLFNYADTGIFSGELHVPQGQETRLIMTAQDVLHAFWVPELRLKQDIMPGQETELAFVPTRPGRYPIICAELCGPYHGGMKAEMIVDTPEEYAVWEQSQIASQPSETMTVAQATETLDPTIGDRSDADYLEPAATAIAPAVDAAAIAALQATPDTPTVSTATLPSL